MPRRSINTPISTVGSGNKKNNVKKGTLDFQQAYREMCDEMNVDPLRVMFKLLKSRDLNIRFHAAKELLPYRFPKQASIQVETDTPTQIEFTWGDEQEEIDIIEGETIQ